MLRAAAFTIGAAALAACSTSPPVVVQLPPTPPVDVRAECLPPELSETDALQMAYTIAAAFGRCRSAALFLDGAWRELSTLD